MRLAGSRPPAKNRLVVRAMRLSVEYYVVYVLALTWYLINPNATTTTTNNNDHLLLLLLLLPQVAHLSATDQSNSQRCDWTMPLRLWVSTLGYFAIDS